MLLTRRSFLTVPVTARALRSAALSDWEVADGPESAFYEKDGEILASPSSAYPAWLRSRRTYENFDMSLEWFSKGWTDGGVYFSAPEHGTKSRCGFKISLFQQVDDPPKTNSATSVFPVIAPKKVNVREGWNTLRIRFDWPRLDVWSNGEQIHELDCERRSELKHRLRSGRIGFEALTYPHRWRNIRIAPLAAKENWETLFAGAADLAKWELTELNQRTPARFDAYGGILRSDGLGNLTTRGKYRDFALQLYARGAHQHNGGILFRSQGGRERYEIQLHDVPEAHYPTGSLYGFQRAKYPEVRSEQWALYQLWVKDRECVVRVDGETVLEYDRLENLQAGFIELQAHQNGRWMEYKDIRIKRL
jgi:hypothetical protein